MCAFICRVSLILIPALQSSRKDVGYFLVENGDPVASIPSIFITCFRSLEHDSDLRQMRPAAPSRHLRNPRPASTPDRYNRLQYDELLLCPIIK
jgi:hypothetical protein